jgi:hypothetical protein
MSPTQFKTASMQSQSPTHFKTQNAKTQKAEPTSALRKTASVVIGPQKLMATDVQGNPIIEKVSPRRETYEAKFDKFIAN